MTTAPEAPKPLSELLGELSPNLPFVDITGIPDNGYIERLPDGKVLVIAKGAVGATGFPGVECLNPDQENNEGKVFYRIFEKNKIFLADEYDQATKELRPEKNVVVISMNGFTRIKPADLQLWGLDEGEYELACLELFNSIIKSVRERFKGIDIKLVDGGSDLGIDKVLNQARRDNELDGLSFSCPQWAFYVPDDGRNLFVGRDSEDYADRYIQSLDCLVATGGKEQAFKHDIFAAVKYGKYITFVDVAGALARNGGVPAVTRRSDGTNEIQNAAAAMQQFISVVQGQDQISIHGQGERWKAMVIEAGKRVNENCFKVLPPNVKFDAKFTTSKPL